MFFEQDTFNHFPKASRWVHDQTILPNLNNNHGFQQGLEGSRHQEVVRPFYEVRSKTNILKLILT